MLLVSSIITCNFNSYVKNSNNKFSCDCYSSVLTSYSDPIINYLRQDLDTREPYTAETNNQTDPLIFPLCISDFPSVYCI